MVLGNRKYGTLDYVNHSIDKSNAGHRRFHEDR